MQIPTLSQKPLETLVGAYSAASVFRTIGFIGDSLSSGEIELVEADGTHSYHDLYEYAWGNFIARKNGQEARIFARGGMTAREYMQSFAEERGYWAAELACQAYVIALGVNDLTNQHQTPGTLRDIDPSDWRKNAPSFLGFYAQIIARYRQIQPEAKFFLVTMPRSDAENHLRAAQEQREVLYALAGYFENTYVVDLYQYAPVYDEEFRRQYYLNGHMTATGYVLTAQIIDSYLDWLIRSDPDGFRRAALIGTGIR